MPEHAQCVFKPQTSRFLSGGPQTIQLTVNTSDVFGYGDRVGHLGRSHLDLKGRGSPMLAGIFFPLATLCGVFGCFFRRCGVRFHRLLLLIVVGGLSLGLEACSGKLPGETTPGTYRSPSSRRMQGIKQR
jgi:hypothetical protein